MHLLNNLKIRSLSLFVVILLSATAVFSQQNVGSIRGEVKDEFGGVIVGATVKAIAEDGTEKTATTDASGVYVINNLKPGTYTIVVEAKSFSPGSQTGVEVIAGKRQEVSLSMTVEIAKEEVNVNPDAQLSTNPDDNKSALVLKPEDLEGLPEDPDELAAALQALAGPSAGPNGGQIYIDGFTGGRMPPREAIREVRINQNPFSAEFERIGFGRIEILTRPGFDRFRGSANFNFNDESLNSRNPLQITRAPHQNRNYGFNLGGPIKKNKASFFVDFNRREGDDNAYINARILDPALNEIPFIQTVITPVRSISFSPRVDYAINNNNTLIGRYSYSRRTNQNRGVGDFSLPSRVYDTSGTDQLFQLTETSVVSSTIVNETRFQFTHSEDIQDGDNTIPTVNVSQSFTAGGSQIGQSFNNNNRWEISNSTTWLYKNHTFKFGGRLRGVKITDFNENGFGGSLSFFGDRCLERDENNAANCIVNGTSVPFVDLTSLDQFRGRVIGTTTGRFLPSQFSISIGDPEASVRQFDSGAYILDDWRLRPNLTVSLGLRYENQSNINSNFNFAPRVSVAWAPGGGGTRQPKMTFRGGFGVFYDRFGENNTLQTIRFDGFRQRQYVLRSTPTVENSAVNNLLRQIQFNSNGVATNLPTAQQLEAFAPQTNVIRRVDPNFQSPYTIQSAFSVERQLPYNINMSVTYINTRTLHTVRTRNINAPIVLGYTSDSRPILQVKPGSPIYEYESSGRFNQNQLNVNLNARVNPKLSIFGNYSLGKSNSDADGFPAYTYDLFGEYGRSSFDVRHRFTIGGSIILPWQINVNPFIIANTGRPLNIVLGQDLNGDLQTTERPTFAQLRDRCEELSLTNSFCDVSGVSDLNAFIPRNYAEGPGYINVNLRVGKTFNFGSRGGAAARNNQQGNQQGGNQQAGNRGGGGNNRGGGGGGNRGGGGGGPQMVMAGGGGGGMGGFGGGGNESRFSLNVSVNVSNVLNTFNKSNPIGSLSSPSFGQSLGLQGGFGGFGGGGGGIFIGGGGGANGNRRIDLSLRFSF